MNTLLLRFAGPLQSWGTESRFNTRQTGRSPSKSGVIGLLAAALGRRRDEDLTDLGKLLFGVRTDHEGTLLRDFHMVHYLKTADVTNRYYLSDAVFLVGLASEDKSFLEELEQAVKAPAWPLYLGRRSCPPTQPLCLGIRECGLEEALRSEPWQLPEWRQEQWKQKHHKEQVRLPIEMDTEAGGSGSALIQDDPISFDQRNRQYRFRSVSRISAVPVVISQDIDIHPTSHDAFLEVEDS